MTHIDESFHVADRVSFNVFLFLLKVFVFRCRCNAIAVKKLVQSNCRLLSLLLKCVQFISILKAILEVEQTVARNFRIS